MPKKMKEGDRLDFTPGPLERTVTSIAKGVDATKNPIVKGLGVVAGGLLAAPTLVEHKVRKSRAAERTKDIDFIPIREDK